jgi:tetratricopeptide (TPR) repeat protein
MLNVLIALAVGVVITVLIKVAGFSIWAGVVPGVLAFIGSYIFLARRIALKVQALSKAAEKELSAQPNNQRERQQRIEKAIKLLEDGLVYDRWQFLIGSEIHAQIGMIHYVAKDYPQAEVHLAKANARNFMARALQAALYYQRKEYDRMERSFESAVKSGKKEAVVWAAYAWCLSQLKEKEKAMKVMARAVEANPSDEKLKAGLTALQNDKKLRMKAFEPLWWQFGLEQPPMQVAPGGRRVQFQRR